MEDNALKVHLELFEGPLDLLLYLIRKNHIDIYDIPVASVLQQYLEYIELMRMCDINVAAEYMVIAATLIQIKSRMLIPQNEEAVENGEEEDPRADLVRKLLEYQKFKEAADFLREKETQMNRQVLRQETVQDYRPENISLKASIFDLMSAFQKALKNIPKDVFFEVIKDEYTVEEKIDFIVDLIEEDCRLELSELFERCRSKLELVTTFLAVLELIKMNKVLAMQPEVFGSITLVKPEQEDGK